MNNVSELLEQIDRKLSRLEKIAFNREKPFLNIDEAAFYTGIPKNTLYGFTSKGRIPFYKLNDRRLYFSIDDLNDFVLSRKNYHKSDSQLENGATLESR